MTEKAIIALIGALLGALELLLTTILGWIAFEIRSMRKTLEEKVDSDDCDRAMCRHYGEIEKLWGETRRNAENIAKMAK